MRVPFQVEYLNHASVLLELGEVRLLSDPWYEGTAFSGGWGLSYAEPEAYRRASRATHLWISHWHSDHLHAATLRELARRSPGLVVLANESANFSMGERLRGLGFSRVIPFPEREPIDLGGGVRVVRYPAAGIDNMLHVRAGGWSLLNYNDCNLPRSAARRLARRMGPVDLMLTNYNHAGKLMDREDDSARKRTFLRGMLGAVEAVGPRWVVPFASSHFYRCPWSLDQNASLWSFDELERETAGDARFAVLRVGDRAQVSERGVEIEARRPPLEPQERDVLDYGEPVPWDELVRGCARRCRQMDRHFLGAVRLLPTLRVRLDDHGRTVALRGGRGAVDDRGAAPHIATHSRALLRWLGQPFGDDTFFAGAHFGILRPDPRALRAIRAWALATLLDGSRMTPRHALRYLGRRAGRRFLWNRREETLAVLLGARWRAGELRS